MKLINLPNSLTLVNLFAGCMALIFIFTPGYLHLVAWCTLVSLVADYFDGFAARFTNNKTDIGKELDSLADMVSFGVVPGAIVFSMLQMYYRAHAASENEMLILLYAAPAFLITLFSALRLAKFNLDTRQTEGFIGLATPANTIFVVGLLLTLLSNQYGMAQYILQPVLLYGITLVLSLLLISEMPMFGFKFKHFKWQGNEIRFVFIILALILLGVFKFVGLWITIAVYVITSVVIHFLSKSKIQQS
ncbi:MAG: CDP-alcohol phosphatidyltransferase family protein [Chitinophagales bacterium]